MLGDIFGGLFDFDMDGKTDDLELALGLCMMDEEERRMRAMDAGLDPDDDEALDELDDF